MLSCMCLWRTDGWALRGCAMPRQGLRGRPPALLAPVVPGACCPFISQASGRLPATRALGLPSCSQAGSFMQPLCAGSSSKQQRSCCRTSFCSTLCQPGL